MANGRTSNQYAEQATVDTAPGSSGYFTNSINPRQLGKHRGIREIYFSVRGTGKMAVTLQFKITGDTTWYDYY